MKKGFTLIELMVTISIVGVLMAIGMVSYTQANRNARNTRRAADIEQVRSAIEMYRNDYPSYPSASSWSNLMTTLNPYLSQSTTIADPRTGYTYSYLNPPSGAGASCRAYALCYTFEPPTGSNQTRCVCNP